jgi:hypothetical protein
MKKFLTALGILLLGTAIVAETLDTQADLAEALRKARPDRKPRILVSIKAIPAAERQPVLENALIEEALRLNDERAERRDAVRTGQAVIPVASDAEYVSQVLDTLAEETSPAVLPALLLFIDTNTRTMKAVADFGETALPYVVAMAKGNDRVAAGSALFTLEFMLTRPSIRTPLSAQSRTRIVEVAKSRLHGVQAADITTPAVRLAVATGDPELLKRVRSIVVDPHVAVELGGLDQQRTSGLRAEAAKALEEARLR